MLDIMIVGFYLILTLFVGVWISKNVRSSEEYKTGGRDYPAWMVFATLSASFIGGGFTIGLAGKTFLYGLAYVIAIWGFSVKELLVATIIAPRMKPFHNALTVGDIMSHAFGQRAKFITGIASVLVCGGIIGAQVTACGNIFYTFLGTPQFLGSLVAAGIVVIYATLGGMKSVVAVDVLHFGILIIMIPLVFLFGLKEIGGPSHFIQALPTTHVDPIGVVEPVAIVILFFSFFLGETLIPPYIQRLLIGKTMKETQRGTLWSGLLSIPFFLVIGCIGMIALLLEPNLPPHLALPFVIKAVMPIGLKGLAIAAMLAVVMSSADSFLNSTATAMVNDVLTPLGMHPKTEKQALFTSRLVTLIIGIVAICFALSSSSALDILLYSYQFWTPFILMPLIAAIFGVRSSDTIFITSAIAGIIGVVAWNIIYPKTLIDGALEGVIFGVLLNSITFIICQKWFFANKPEEIIPPEFNP